MYLVGFIRYKYNNTVFNGAHGGSGAGKLTVSQVVLHQLVFSQVDTIAISEFDQSSTDTESFLSQIASSSSAIKGHVRINRKTFTDEFVMFSITGVTNNTGIKT